MKNIHTRLKKFGKLKDKKTRERLRITKLQNQLEKLWEDLTLAELYELRESTSDKSLIRKIEEEILEMANGENDLWEIIRHEGESLREKAWKKLSRRIKNGDIRKKHARETLLKIIKEVLELRIKALDLFKTLDPSAEELREILKFEFIYSAPALRKRVEKMLRKKQKKKSRVREILELFEEISKLKKEQS